MPAFAPAWSIIWAIAVLTCAGCMSKPPTPPDNREVVTIGTETFRLEVSADDATRAQGLMFRNDLPADGGMIFIFPDSAVRSFWMKNCVMDIDLMFLDARGRVTATHRMVQLPPQGETETDREYERRVSRKSHSSVLPAQFAIELVPGSLDRLEIGVDQRIDLDLERLKKLAK